MHKTIVRLALTVLFGSVLYATTVRAGELIYEEYNCCGNESSPMYNACRFTNRDTNCNYDSTCSGTYEKCCEAGCVK